VQEEEERIPRADDWGTTSPGQREEWLKRFVKQLEVIGREPAH
jgi:hypothetical protein